jgi:periplasmic protein TonB
MSYPPDRTRSRLPSMRLPVILSLAGHLAVLTPLILFMTGSRPPPEPLEKSGIAVAFAPFAVQPQATLAPVEPVRSPVPPTVASVPLEETVAPLLAPEEPAAAVAQVPVVPPEQAVTAEARAPPPPKPALKPKPKYVERRQETSRPLSAPPRYAPVSMAAVAASQYAAGSPAAAPAASLPGPDPSVNYRALISAWFESHKRYPDSARERGEEGSVGLRFRVDRYGRVIDYALLNSTGYADLDQGVEQMMSGAQLPPFPPGMTAPQIEVSVRIGFSLTR